MRSQGCGFHLGSNLWHPKNARRGRVSTLPLGYFAYGSTQPGSFSPEIALQYSLSTTVANSPSWQMSHTNGPCVPFSRAAPFHQQDAHKQTFGSLVLQRIHSSVRYIWPNDITEITIPRLRNRRHIITTYSEHPRCKPDLPVIEESLFHLQ